MGAGTALKTVRAVKCCTSRLARFFLFQNICKGVGERVKMTGDHRLWEACYKAKRALVLHTQLCFMLKVYNFWGVSDQERGLKYFYVDKPYWSKRITASRNYYKCIFLHFPARTFIENQSIKKIDYEFNCNKQSLIPKTLALATLFSETLLKAIQIYI